MEKEKYDKAHTINQQINSLRKNIESLQKITENDYFKSIGATIFFDTNLNENICLNKDLITALVQECKKKIEILEQEFTLL